MPLVPSTSKSGDVIWLVYDIQVTIDIRVAQRCSPSWLTLSVQEIQVERIMQRAVEKSDRPWLIALSALLIVVAVLLIVVFFRIHSLSN